MIERLDDIRQSELTGQVYDAETQTYKNTYTEIIRKPNIEELCDKINEIIDYINSKED